MTTFDQTEIRAALAGADIRVLLMVLFHLTGDRRWLEQPFQPTRDVRLFADISAGSQYRAAAAGARRGIRATDGWRHNAKKSASPTMSCWSR